MNKDSIKDYTNSLASDRKTTITQLINVIEQNIPKGFEKVMNYGMPSFVIPHSIYLVAIIVIQLYHYHLLEYQIKNLPYLYIIWVYMLIQNY